jgi:choline dehydrogenase-like flavoprotein
LRAGNCHWKTINIFRTPTNRPCQGCVIASRLAEYLPHKKILLIEAGPSDFMDDRVLDLKQWLNLLGGELDYDYGTTEQPMG